MALSPCFGQGAGHNHKEHSTRELAAQDPQKPSKWQAKKCASASSAVPHLLHGETNCPGYTKASKL